MSFAPIAGGIGRSAGGSAANTTQFDSTGAQLLIAATSWYTPGADCVLNDGLNTFITLTKFVETFTTIQIGYVINPVTSATHNVGSSGTGSFMSVVAESFSCGGTCVYDTPDVGNTGTLVTSLTVGSKTPAQGSSLVISVLGFFGASGTPDSGTFTCGQMDAVPQQLNYSGNGLGVALGYALSVTSAINPVWSWTVSGIGYTAHVAGGQAIFSPPVGAPVDISLRQNFISNIRPGMFRPGSKDNFGTF